MEWIVAGVLLAIGAVIIGVIVLGRSQGLAPHRPFSFLGFRDYVRKIDDGGGAPAAGQASGKDNPGEKKS